MKVYGLDIADDKGLTNLELVDYALNVIKRNTDIVQRLNSHVCGHLCLVVLTALTCKHSSSTSERWIYASKPLIYWSI